MPSVSALCNIEAAFDAIPGTQGTGLGHHRAKTRVAKKNDKTGYYNGLKEKLRVLGALGIFGGFSGVFGGCSWGFKGALGP